MYATDFEYDHHYLSDFGFVICSFDDAGLGNVTAGSQITFNTVSRHYGKKYSLTSTQYDSCIETTFDICKDPCLYTSQDDLRITNDECREIMRWLNRREFLKFSFTDDDNLGMGYEEQVYYYGSFNIEKIILDTELVGLRLTLTTDKPFGYGEERTANLSFTTTSLSEKLIDASDEIGYTYPSITITLKASGKLTISNDVEGSPMVIDNCSEGEVITVDGSTHIITTSLVSHKLYDDFNFEFLRIGNTYDNRTNVITVSLPCEMELRYTPVIKNSPD